MEKVTKQAIQRVEQTGIIFLDEIDKIAGAKAVPHGPGCSREGVQRDLLPIVEGSTVTTKYGMVQNGPYPVHRRRRFPLRKALGPHPRAPGAVSDPGGAGIAGQEGFHADSHRAAERIDQAVQGAHGHRGNRAHLRGERHRKVAKIAEVVNEERKTSGRAGCTPSWKAAGGNLL